MNEGVQSDPFGRALRDHHDGTQTGPLRQRDGQSVRDHPIESLYFDPFTATSPAGHWLESRLSGPLLDLGAGAGRHTLYFQESFETVALEMSEHLVETMRDRGVRDVRTGDMFALTDQFEADRFSSVLAWGTQLGLAKSMAGVRRFFEDLTVLTRSDGTVIVDGYDPTVEETTQLLGYRGDPTPGLAFRVLHFEYEGDVGQTLLFRLFSPNRLREAVEDTQWDVTDVHSPEHTAPGHFCIALSR